MSVALLLSAVGVHCTIPVRMLAALTAVVPSSDVPGAPWYLIIRGVAEERAYNGFADTIKSPAFIVTP